MAVATSWARPVGSYTRAPLPSLLAHKVQRTRDSLRRQTSVECSRLVQRAVSVGRLSKLESKLEEKEKKRRVVGAVRARSDDEDDEGVVRDMERYLNELAIEYDNVWDTKPAWCQPWTIVLTGVTGIAFSYLLVRSAILTGVVTLLVAAWWFIFLYSYPQAYTEMIAQRRKNQKDGLEDTYGLQQRK